MQCTNTACARPLEDGTKFCPYCGATQLEASNGGLPASPSPAAEAVRQSLLNAETDLEPGSDPLLDEDRLDEGALDPDLPSETGTDPAPPSLMTVAPPPVSAAQVPIARPAAPPPAAPARAAPRETATGTPRPAPAPAPTAGLIMRASDNIWDFEESEENVSPGQRRALLVVGEQVTHLAHTDRQLTPDELLKRTTDILEKQEVPVRLNLLNARWMREPQEVRPRLVATLANRRDNDIFVVFGVDYLGKWASINFQVGIEPDALPVIPADTWQPPIWMWIALGAGVLLTITVVAAIIGVPLALFAAWSLWQDNEKHKAKKIAEGRQVAEDYQRRLQQKLYRTYKVDDARLFTAAMNQVYKAVVDDIVARGAEVVRVTGGRGGFIDNDGVASAVPARGSDAAMADV